MDHYVSDNAGLQAAIANSSPGDVIYLATGTAYEFEISQYPPAQASGLTFRSTTPATPAVIAYAKVHDTSDITFDGVIFDNDQLPNDNALLNLFNGQNITIDNVEFRGDASQLLTAADLSAQAADGIKAVEVDGFTVTNTLFTNLNFGIKLKNSTLIDITDNELTLLQGDGINLNGVQDVSITGNNIHDFIGSEYDVNHMDMIQLFTFNTAFSSRDIDISGNILNSGDGVATQSILIGNEAHEADPTQPLNENITITQNVIYNGQFHGISVYGTDGVVISNNALIADPDAVFAGPATDPVAYVPRINALEGSLDVTVTNNASAAVSTDNPAEVTASNNLVLNFDNPGNAGYYLGQFNDPDAGDFRVLEGSFAADNALGTGVIASSAATTGMLSGRYFVDSDGSETESAGDGDEAGRTVELLAAGAVIGTTTTATDGTYSFTGLAAGDYQVAFAQADGSTVFVSPDIGGDDTIDSDVTSVMTPAFGGTADAVLTMGVTDTTEYGNKFNGQTDSDGVVSFGFVTDGSSDLTLSVSGFDIDNSSEVEVFLNGNSLGVLATGVNNGLSSHSLTLTAADLSDGDNVISFEQTLNPLYKWGVTDLLLTGGTAPYGKGLTDTITVAAGQTITDVDAGTVAFSASVSGRYFVDSDGSETESAGDGDEAGRTVELLAAGAVIGTTTTATDGTYSFTGLAAGDYQVAFAQADGSTVFVSPDIGGDDTIDSDVTSVMTPAFGGTADAVLTMGVTDTTEYGNKFNGQTDSDGVVSFGFVTDGSSDLTLSVSGFDIDNSSEVEVFLNGNSLGALATGVNNGLSSHSLTLTAADLSDGDNVISFEQTLNPLYKWGVTDLLLTGGTAPYGKGLTDTITVAAGQTITDVDAGTVAFSASVSGRYFVDSDGSETESAGDGDEAGRTVELLAAGAVIGTTTTATDGTYSFTGLAAGDYQVAFAQADGSTVFVSPDIGGDDTIDSDVTSVMTPAFGGTADAVLTMGVTDTTEYGNKFNGQTDSDGVVSFGFVTDGSSDLTLSVSGFDIDNSSEVEVFLNGNSLGALATGVNNGLSSHSLTLTAADLSDGDNVISFEQTLNPLYKWGVTDLLLTGGTAPYGKGLTDTITVAAGQTITDVDAGVVFSVPGDPEPDDYALEAVPGATVLDVLTNDAYVTGIASVDTAAILGQVTIAGDGLSLSYDPGTAFDGLAQGQSATETFTYDAIGADGVTVTETVTITISPPIPPEEMLIVMSYGQSLALGTTNFPDRDVFSPTALYPDQVFSLDFGNAAINAQGWQDNDIDLTQHAFQGFTALTEFNYETHASGMLNTVADQYQNAGGPAPDLLHLNAAAGGRSIIELSVRGSDVYGDVATGLAGTSDGVMFAIDNTASTGAFDYYLNAAGTAVSYGSKAPFGNFTQNVYFDNLVDQLQLAHDEAIAQNYTLQDRVVFNWIQGQSDTSTADYGMLLELLVDRLDAQADAIFGSDISVTAIISQHRGYAAKFVATDQIDYVLAKPDAYFGAPEFQFEASEPSIPGLDHTHISSEAYFMMGQTIGHNLYEALEGGGDAPITISNVAYVTGSELLVSLTGIEGDLVDDPSVYRPGAGLIAPSHFGFGIYNDQGYSSGPLPNITSAVIEGTDQVRLMLDAVVEQDIRLYLGRNDDDLTDPAFAPNSAGPGFGGTTLRDSLVKTSLIPTGGQTLDDSNIYEFAPIQYVDLTAF